MTMPYYVAPEQAMKDKADFARKGIARGRSAVVLTFADGVLLCAENPSTTLRKLAEIYDRIAFAGVGKFNEFDQLRIAGIRHADLKGYSYSREDVDARSLANQYAQILGQIFTHEMKPMEVEIVVAEIGDDPSRDQLYHIRYDGTVIDETRFIVIGGDSETIATRLGASYESAATLDDALRVAVEALGGPERTIPPDELEVALLSRSNGRRAFRRLDDDQVAAALSQSREHAARAAAPPSGASAAPAEPEPEGGGSATPT